MKNKVILISVDGVRADGLRACGNPCVKELEKLGSYTYDARSMVPSVTFPCHFSMSRSVVPARHGNFTNTYTPEVRPIKGLFERIKENGGVSAMFYGWEPMRDIAFPGSLTYSVYMHSYSAESTDTLLTDEALSRIDKSHPDFVFLYMAETDDKGGHDTGWMSDEYLRRVSLAYGNVKRIVEHCKDEYTVIVMTDHGGHDRTHGTEMPEDMVIPFFFIGKDFTPGKELSGLSLLDIAPTVVKVMGIPAVPEWEGKPVF